MEKHLKPTWSFPTDLISEILLRLPEKSVRRFRCVSKLWSSITTEPCFIKSFETRSITRPTLVLCLQRDDELFVSSIPQHTHQNSIRSCSSSQPIDRYRMILPGDSYFSGMESVHGLICFEVSGTPIVWNPSTRQLLTLPKPKMRHIIAFLGYDPVQGKHKVVCIPYERTCYVSLVFTLGSGQESWRTVKTYHKHRVSWLTTGRCIKGVIYYIADNCLNRDEVIMSFDVRSENFRMIKIPSDIGWDLMITYKGRLACADRYNKARLWVLEDAENDKWSFQDFLLSLRYWCLSVLRDSREDIYNFTLEGCTHAGEFIYVPIRFRESSFILFYDPVRNCCRRLQFEGIADDESGRVSRYALRVFPDHIENITCL